MELKKCTKCDGEMEEGALGAPSLGYGVLVWFDKLVNFGLKKTNKEFKVINYRCVSCGYLESYAK